MSKKNLETLESVKLEKDALLLESEAKSAESILISALNQSGIFDLCYARKSRVKDKEGLIKKLRRKKKEKEYSLTHITDVVGVRLVALFRLEMPIIFEKVINIINHNFSLSPNPFKKKLTEEVIIYAPNTNDPITEKIIRILKNINADIKPEVKVSVEGYTSIHIVARLDYETVRLQEFNEKYSIPLEIQIRTVFEDAWGEIDHKYGYEQRRDTDNHSKNDSAEAISDHLKILKKFSDACADYANQIHIEATGYKEETVLKTLVHSVKSDDKLIEHLTEVGVSNAVVKGYVTARKKREDATKIFGENKKKAKKLYRSAAKQFHLLVDTISPDYLGNDTKSKDYLIYYYSKMNQAISLMSTQDKIDIENALIIYLSLDKIYKNFPLLKMRLGQALGKTGQTHRAFESLNCARDLVKNLEKQNKVGKFVLPRPDYDHMKRYLPILIGYETWKTSLSIDSADKRSTKQKIKLLLKAYDFTLEASEWIKGDKAITMNNNLLYYSFEVVELLEGKENKLYLEVNARIVRQVKKLDKMIDTDNYWDIDILDSLAKGYFHVKRYEDCYNLCQIIIELCVTKPEKLQYEPAFLDETLAEAWYLLKSSEQLKKDTKVA